MTDVIATGELGEDEIMQLAAASRRLRAPAGSGDPGERGAARRKPRPGNRFQCPGRSRVEAQLDGRRLLLGNDRLMAERGIDCSARADVARELAAKARTPMYFAVDGTLAAIIAVADPIKADSAAAIRRLRDNGLRVVMLTGDNQATARRSLGRSASPSFMPRCCPEDKAAKVAELQAQGSCWWV